jgi:DNA-binding beta-propeller fold protein YncE
MAVCARAEFGDTGAVAVDTAGNIAMADTFGNVIWVVAAATGTFYGQAMTAGDIYVVAGNTTSNLVEPPGPPGTDGLGDGLPATQARFRYPSGVAITPSGDLLVADSGNNRIRSISR